ncbi:MAG: ABC transporter ATP-binding protein [Cytophagales bacterium]|nr:ABC transporter ATP-binding protein [Cytophagales bacterium]
MLEIKQVYKKYDTVEVLKGVDLRIEENEVVSIVGASGAGKSTLLHILGTLDRPDSGELRMDGQDLLHLNEEEQALFRNRHMGFVFQFHNLLPEFTALENVCIPGFIANRNENEVKEQAEDLLNLLGLSHRLDHKPQALSGGEQQRVAIARALINSPKVIFGDEPSGNLDSKGAGSLHELFFRLRDELGCTFVLVTHNSELAAMADRRLEMKDGKLINDFKKR